MPGIRDGSSADRVLGQRINMHPRRGGDLILAPDDILEGIGSFLEYDADGNPVGWRLGQVEVPDGRNVYVGRTPDTTIKVTPRPLGYERPSQLINFDLPEVGQPPPNPNSPGLAKIPRATAPALRKMLAEVEGYEASTPAKPHWYAIAYVKNGNLLTGYGPPVSFQLQYGQSFRAPLPDRNNLPEGIYQVALLMAEPGTSTAFGPGPLRVQKIVDLRYYFLPYYEMTGPFRSTGLPATTANGTTLPTPPAPRISRDHGNYGARCATYTARIVWTDDNGETIEGAPSPPVTIGQSSRYTVYAEEGTLVYKPGAGYVPATNQEPSFRAGEGRVTVYRPTPPVGATGWKALLYIQPIFGDADFSTGWRWVVNKNSQRGDSLPFLLSQTYVSTAGWEGSEEYYAKNDSYICVDADLPDKNTTGTPPPEDELPAPEPMNASRPEPGDLWVRTTDTVRGRESLPSVAKKIALGDADICSVVFVDPSNRLPNPSFVETDPKGDPLYWTIARTGGLARVEATANDPEGQQLVLETEKPESGATPQAETDFQDLEDNTTPDYLDVAFDVEPPVSQLPAGTFDVTLIEELSDGSTVSRVLVSRSTPGEYAETFEIKGSKELSGFRWHILALKWKLRYSFGGASKNLRARIRHSRHRHDRHMRRLDRRRRKPPRKPPKPGRPPVKIQDPPEPPWSPETFPIPGPDRPLDTGTLVQLLNFDAAMPQGFSVSTSGNGTATRTPGAAIGGTANGLRLFSGAAGALSHAAVSKVIPPPAAGWGYRHAMGVYLRNRFATLPTGGSIRMHEVKDSDGPSLAWLEMSTQLEKVGLTIDTNPTAPGNASITLDTTSHTLGVVGATEVQDVAIDTAPSAIGTMSIGPAGVNQLVAPGGIHHKFSVTVGSAPSNGNDIEITAHGVKTTIGVVATDTRNNVATKIANANYTHYNAVIGNVGNVINFESKQAGNRTAPSIIVNSNGTGSFITHIQNGVYESREATASRVAALAFAGWTATISPAGAHVVRFTAATAGAKVPPAVSAGTTLAALTATTVTDGFVDTRAQFASRIAAGTYPGWTQAIDPQNSARVIFTAATAGVRQKSSYRPLDTGATGTINTIIQGSNGDLTAHARDADGTVQRRKIISAIAANLIFNTDISISGATTDRAVVSVWGSLNNDSLKLLARFEDVDLTGLSADVCNVGVTEESGASLTWELHCDEGEVNNRGRFFYRDHTAEGKWAPQAFLYTEKTQPIRQDLFLQDARAAVVPGSTYTVSLFARADIQANLPAKLLKVTGLVSGIKAGATSSTRDLGDVTDTATAGVGLTGRTAWVKYEKTVEIPGDVFEVVLNSRQLGAAEIVVQEVVMSEGPTGLRTGLYKTSGEYIATFDLRTPRTNPQFKPWTQERVTFGATVDEPLASTTMTRSFRSAPASSIDPTIPDQAVWTTYTENGDEVPDQDFVQAKFVAAGPGHKTPALKAGSPYVEYLLKLGPKRMSTLLKGDRSELPGGVAFAEIHEWSERTAAGRKRLPSGRFHDEPSLFPPFGHFPACKIMVFDQETRNYIDENWRELFVAEVFGQDAITIKLGKQPEWVRESRYVTEDGGYRQTVYTAQLADSEVVQAVPLPRPA